jgi:hypothetical protein
LNLRTKKQTTLQIVFAYNAAAAWNGSPKPPPTHTLTSIN